MFQYLTEWKMFHHSLKHICKILYELEDSFSSKNHWKFPSNSCLLIFFFNKNFFFYTWKSTWQSAINPDTFIISLLPQWLKTALAVNVAAHVSNTAEMRGLKMKISIRYKSFKLMIYFILTAAGIRIVISIFKVSTILSISIEVGCRIITFVSVG